MKYKLVKLRMLKDIAPSLHKGQIVEGYRTSFMSAPIWMVQSSEIVKQGIGIHCCEEVTDESPSAGK